MTVRNIGGMVIGAALALVLALGACNSEVTVEAGDAAEEATPSGPLDFAPFMIAISVTDLEASTAWYADKLGFTPELDAENGSTRYRWIRNGDQRIELVQYEGAAENTRPPVPGHLSQHGFSHVTMKVADIEATRDALAERGVEILLDVTPVESLGIYVMFVEDPDGNAIEIAQPLPAAAGEEPA